MNQNSEKSEYFTGDSSNRSLNEELRRELKHCYLAGKRLLAAAYLKLLQKKVDFSAPPLFSGKLLPEFNIHQQARCILGKECEFLNNRIKTVLDVRCPGAHLEIGDYSFINEGVRIWASTQVVIGSYAKIGDRVTIYDTDLHEITPNEWRYASVHIGSNVWIGTGAVILPGVKIGNHSVVGAGSIVTKEIPERCIAAGVPARIIRAFECPNDWVRR
ncbi:acyltransferase [Leptolyngbya sp. NK1-12]|uniref:Acyltransferase n=1 Tax=Leptolyngbya sp. NK1-12 TaxID=2547451 RepID=A0AA97ALM9_9CYAN|nr:acyltransferase [Leptolyngbya sp. NK1-12]WNZ27676.1 acyltransferase [Leptolyngbya sp. NK1-12]